MNSLEETSSIAIDYINHEIKMKRDNDIAAHNATIQLIQGIYESFTFTPDINFILNIVLFISQACTIAYLVIIQREVHPHNIKKKHHVYRQRLELKAQQEAQEHYTEPASKH